MSSEYLFDNKNKGFTLMEMLIVVAIIAILIAISIPALSNSLERAREATDMANIRSAYALLETALVDDSIVDTTSTFDTNNPKNAIGKVLVAKKNGKTFYVTAVKLVQGIAEWQSIPKRPGLMIGEMEFWLTTDPKKKNCFYFSMDMEGHITKDFWGMVYVK